MRNLLKFVALTALLAGCGADAGGEDSAGEPGGARHPMALDSEGLVGKSTQALSGTRPTLLLVYEVDPALPIPQTDQSYRDRVFGGPSAPRSVNTYFNENSRGQVSLSVADVRRVRDLQYRNVETWVDFPSIPAHSQGTANVGLPGSILGDRIYVRPGQALPAGLGPIVGGTISNGGFGVVIADNPTDAAIDPPPIRVGAYSGDLDVRAGIDNDMLFNGGDTLAFRRRAIQLAIDGGFNFAPYDTLAPKGIITEEELAVVVMYSASQGWGQDGPINGWRDRDQVDHSVPCLQGAGQPQFCGRVALAGHRSTLMNIAHELSHQIGGTVDLYGAGCRSQNLTLMSCTAFIDGDPGLTIFENATFFLDPWHRKNLSWTKASNTKTEANCPTGTTCSAKLALASKHYGTLPAGSIEFQEFASNTTSAGVSKLYMEYRAKGFAYDDSVPQDGVVFWMGKFDASGNLQQVGAFGPGEENAMFSLAPAGCTMNPLQSLSRGVTDPGTAMNGEVVARFGSTYRMNWYTGADSGYLFTIGQPAADQTVTVTWTKNNTAPRCVQNGPDYKVSNATVPTFPYISHHGGTLTFTDTTQNLAKATTQSSTTSYYLSVDPVPSSDDILIGSRTVPGLAANASSTGSATGTIPWSAPLGDVYFITCSDTGKTLIEPNETNNCFISAETMLIVF